MDVSQIGPYSVTRELGRGGMGVVYLACDTRLKRQVAIKALPSQLAQDPDRLARFEREARVLAQLNHPNVAGIHGLEEHEGAKYLVLEYVEGETLASRLDRGPLPLDEALEVAVQIAAGVEVAHDAGVVHRDLKPGNIMLAPSGQAKVLDFGLAQNNEATSQSQTNLPDSPTITTPAGQSPTLPGVILGTAAYMSPEQARGRRVDKRTDIWSFGVVLYEMLVGESPFVGETVSDSIGAVLHKNLDLDRLPSGTRANVRRVLERCLVRDKALRFRDIGDVSVELRSPTEDVAMQSPARGRSRAWIAIAVVLAVACVGLAVAMFTIMKQQAQNAITRVVRLSLEPPTGAKFRLSGDLSGPAVVSRDGMRVVFAASPDESTRRLWLRDLSLPDARELNGTEGANFPFWSFDGRYVGFFTPSELRTYDTVSDTVVTVCESSQGRGGAWTEDGRIIFAPRFRGGLVIVDSNGGEQLPLTTLDDELHTSHRWPFVIPGSKHYLFSAVSSRAGEATNNAIYLGDITSERPPQRLQPSDFGGAFAAGHLLYVRDGALLARPLDPVSGQFEGESSLIARDVAPDPGTWHGQFAVSDRGVLVYATMPKHVSGQNQRERGSFAWDMEGDRITSFDYEGRETTAYAVDTPIRTMHLSPDGTTIAYETVGNDGFIDIWLHPTAYTSDLTGESIDPDRVRTAVIDPEPRRFTALPGAEVVPTWSPDGTEIAFRWDGDATRPRGIYRKRIGDGTETLVKVNGEKDDYPVDWTPDGKYLIVVVGTVLVSEFNDIWALPVDGGEMIPLVTSPGADYSPKVSPDGRWLAYTRAGAAGGKWEIAVIPFAPAWPEHLQDRSWVVSQGISHMPRWSPEGDELFFVDQDGRLMGVDVEFVGDSIAFSVPRMMFQTPWDIGRNYDVFPEGVGRDNHFVFVDVTRKNEVGLSVVLNWPILLNSKQSGYQRRGNVGQRGF
ncbi:MAG: protein kinase [Phycisphaerales bacterium]|nr:protein kinase [Phycisphaerales bacterium]